MMHKNTVLRQGTAWLLTAGIAATLFSVPAFAADDIVVGGIFNVTGDQSSLDEPTQQGFDLAIKEINADGGVNGKQLKAVYYDGQTDTAVCASDAKN